LLDTIQSSLKLDSVHINQQKIITEQFLASSCHHKINHQHEQGFAVVNKHLLQTTTNPPANHQ
jgi:hypothetical protein